MRSFTYERATSVSEALDSIARHEGAKFIAGGTNLLDLMKLEIEAPAHLVDIRDLDLGQIESAPGGGLRIGALVTNTDLAADPRIKRDYGVISRAIVSGATGQLRAPERAPDFRGPWLRCSGPDAHRHRGIRDFAQCVPLRAPGRS